jgi:N,N'-diacetyllegionaminate synthase
MDSFSTSVSIGDHKLAVGSDVYVIAEIGSNHDRSLDTAVELVRVAAEAGADAVKFQSFTAETLAAPFAERLQTFFRDNRLPDEWLPSLAETARDAGIGLMSTPFHLGAVQTLVDIGVPALKVASGDLTNHLLLEACAATKLPVIVSTGAAYLGDIERSLGVLADAGARDVIVLHCVSTYPPVIADLNLRAMSTIADAFGVLTGFSDHSPGHTAATAAVARDAVLIEKHLTTDRSLPGPDHPYALTPPEFTALVQAVRDTTAALGSSRKAPTSDADERYWAWRGLYAASDLPAGHVLTRDDLVALRPREGVGGDHLHEVLGRALAAPLTAYDAVTWDSLAPRTDA